MLKVEAKKRTLKILQRLSGERKNKIKDVITALKSVLICYLLALNSIIFRILLFRSV